MSTPTPYSATEEFFHALSHGIGAILSLAALLLMLHLSYAQQDILYVISSSIYGCSLLLMYSSSTLYHASKNMGVKRRLRQLDHAAIFLLIAGTYTPFTLISLRHDWGLALFFVIWSIAVIGVIIELGSGLKYKKLSLALYLGMGWLVVVAIKPMLNNVATEAMWLLLAGGLSYSVGVIFYAAKKLYMHHVIWHLFVLAGSAFHFAAIYFYVF
jgi:hemolysin III